MISKMFRLIILALLMALFAPSIAAAIAPKDSPFYALELAILRLPIEHGYILRSDGFILAHYVGTADYVNVPSAGQRLMRNNVFLHNHPYPSPPYFSLSDVYFMWRTNPQTFVTVGWLWSARSNQFVAYECVVDRGALPSWEAHYPADTWQGNFPVPYLYGQPELMDKFLQHNADGSAWRKFFAALHIEYSCQAL